MTSTARPPGRVSIWLSWSPAEIDSLTGLSERFSLTHPEAEFEIAYFRDSELEGAFVEALQREAGPTIVIGPDTLGPRLWERGSIQDVTELMAPAIREALQPLALSQVTYQGALLGLPLAMDGVVLYANRDLAAQAVVRVEDWIAPAGGTPASSALGSLDFGLLYTGGFMAACGGEWIDPSGQPGFRGPEGECWLGLMRGLSPSGQPAFNTDADLAAFQAGQVAWMVDGTWNLDTIAQAIGPSRLAIDPWPVYEATGRPLAGFVRTENAYLATDLSQADLEASWTFLAYLLSPEAQQQLSHPDRARHLPVVQAIGLTNPLMAEAMDAITSGIPYPLDPRFALYQQPLERAISTVIRQAGDPTLTLQRAEQELASALAPTPTP